MSSTTCSSERLIVVPKTTAVPLFRRQTKEEEVVFSPFPTISIVAHFVCRSSSFAAGMVIPDLPLFIAGDRPIVMERE
jgi:hypothetical protein